MTEVLVSGSSGFVGRALCTCLGQSVRTLSTRTPPSEWGQQLLGIDVVVHLAARVHVMRPQGSSSQDYSETNVHDTFRLAMLAAQHGVRRFVFLSSIKVNGELTKPGEPYRISDEPAPQDAYGISKMEAEIGLREIALETGLEVVIIRPPLVYGPGVKANFASMIQWIFNGVPLPLGAVHNARSLVAVDNLIDLIVTCIDHPAASNQTFLVSDGEDVSTTELLRRTAGAMGRPARLVPVPQWLIEKTALIAGRPEIAQRLCGSLQVDISKTRSLLGWTPPISLDEGLLRAVGHLRRAGAS